MKFVVALNSPSAIVPFVAFLAQAVYISVLSLLPSACNSPASLNLTIEPVVVPEITIAVPVLPVVANSSVAPVIVFPLKVTFTPL